LEENLNNRGRVDDDQRLFLSALPLLMRDTVVRAGASTAASGFHQE
jgi:hypothetical protein